MRNLVFQEFEIVVHVQVLQDALLKEFLDGLFINLFKIQFIYCPDAEVASLQVRIYFFKDNVSENFMSRK